MERLIPTPADLDDPARLLALDEVALDLTEETGRELFWTWESAKPWVVVGLGQSVEREVDLPFCRQQGIPVFRRCSGGGAVVQGPGCLNYAVTLLIEREPALASVTTTNQWVMAQNREALRALGVGEIEVVGHTDLALNHHGVLRKFSGNAQRRRRRALLFHGTLLHHFDLSWLSRCLRHPSAEPAYRSGRSHGDFVVNLRIPPEELIRGMVAGWDAQTIGKQPIANEIEALAAHRYRRQEWNFRR